MAYLTPTVGVLVPVNLLFNPVVVMAHLSSEMRDVTAAAAETPSAGILPSVCRL